MSATAADGFFMKFHLLGGCGVIWGGLSHLKPKPLVTSLTNYITF